MLRRLQAREHPHIIELLAGFEHRKEYFMLFPFAEANLRKYWEAYAPSHPSNRSGYLWSLRQIKGLTAALFLIHNFDFDFDEKTKTLVRNTGNRLNLTVKDAEFGRHGDIKPENILWFSGAQSVLKLADLGLGRFHRAVSRSNVNPRTVAGSETYVPPEVSLEKSVSRAYDIWSFGCVLLEFITWILKGGPSVDDFSEARAEGEGSINDDLFYTIEYGNFGGTRFKKGAFLRRGVVKWIETLKSEPHCTNVLRDLLDLIQNRMLAIDTSDRITSKDLSDEVEKMVQKAENDSVYAFSPLGINAQSFPATRTNDTTRGEISTQHGHVAEPHL
jgi:serine/threonine protein kinase